MRRRHRGDGIDGRVVPASDGSAYREYVLTEKGRGLFVVLMAMRQWGIDWLFESDGSYRPMVDAKNGKLIPRIEVRSEDGRVLGSSDTRFGRLRSVSS